MRIVLAVREMHRVANPDGSTLVLYGRNEQPTPPESQGTLVGVFSVLYSPLTVVPEGYVMYVDVEEATEADTKVEKAPG